MDKFSSLTGRDTVGSTESPLLRTVDRIERAVHRITVALIVATVPLALWLGFSTYSQQEQLSDQIAASTRTVEATTLEDAPKFTMMTSDYSTPPSMAVPAKWTVDGIEHDGQVTVTAGALAGTKTDLVVDEAGLPSAPAASSTDITVVSIFAVIVTVITVVSVLALLGWAVRRQLDRHRDAMWDDALYRFFA
ncbi:membrane protein [Rhodococcoides trifolii]|uniref:Membrane protein n=1 Tax=Rhodococcoides trifolii TaxID=908250 RepID=A0A917FN36_9NOCA|nr:hypothetical protein [Rhodococcus trifolii]GGF92239.1 membrane protein [Rhodococcus trifolii]